MTAKIKWRDRVFFSPTQRILHNLTQLRLKVICSGTSDAAAVVAAADVAAAVPALVIAVIVAVDADVVALVVEVVVAVVVAVDAVSVGAAAVIQ